MGKGSISVIVIKNFLRDLFSDIFKPKKFRLELFYILSIVPIWIFLVALVYMFYYEKAFISCFISLILILIAPMLIIIPEPKVKKEIDIEGHQELVDIKLSYKCNPLMKRIYDEEVLLRFMWDRGSFYDIYEFAKVLCFIHILYNHSISSFWFAEYILIPISLAFIISEPSAPTSLFMVSLIINICTLIIKLNLKKGMEGKLELIERIVLKKPSIFSIGIGVIEVRNDVIKAIRFARKEGIISKSVFLIRNILLSGGNT